MDPAHPRLSPFLDFFRRGEVAPDVRTMAARGALVSRPYEQLALLVLLSADADTEIARTAEVTLARIPREPLEGFLARPEVPSEMRGFFAARGIQPAAVPTVEAEDETLVEAGDRTGPGGPVEVRQLSALPVPERIRLALRGTREQRAVLIRDPNKLVAAAVLSSPKLSESEVEAFARMANLPEEVLRIIGTSRSWTKIYAIIVALARNPKTPPAVSMPILPRLNPRDVKLLSTDRNVPEVLRLAARKFILAAQSRRG